MSDIDDDDNSNIEIQSDNDDDDIEIQSDDDYDLAEPPKINTENEEEDLDVIIDDNPIIDKESINQTSQSDDDDDDGDDDDDEESDKIENIKEQLEYYHNEQDLKSFDQIKPFLTIERNSNNMIIDEYHKTIPILTKYEITKILGMRTVQLDNGLEPFISVPSDVIDSSTIAKMELQQKKIPFIIKRPISHKHFEYWYLNDLEYIE